MNTQTSNADLHIIRHWEGVAESFWGKNSNSLYGLKKTPTPTELSLYSSVHRNTWIYEENKNKAKSKQCAAFPMGEGEVGGRNWHDPIFQPYWKSNGASLM